jgi:hypothetical protein
MYRRTALILAGMTLLGLAVPQSAFTQSEPFAGLWQVNLAKSKYGGKHQRAGPHTFSRTGRISK